MTKSPGRTRRSIGCAFAEHTLSPRAPICGRSVSGAKPGSQFCTGGLLKVAAKFDWRLEAWAVFSNHYHFVGHSPAEEDTAENLSRMLGLLHEKTAKWLNKLDAAPARKVWHNFRETRLTYEKSYLARLNYTHQNPVKHGLVPVANQYPWCSARWFERSATPAQFKTIYRFKTDQLNVPDDFEVSPEW